MSTLKEGTTVRIREDEELVKLLNCRVGWKTEMQAVSGSNPHHAVVTCYVEHCGCEWFKSSLCCSPLLYWTLAVSGSDPHYAASLVILNIVAVSGSNPDYSAVACYIEYCGCEWFTVRLCCSHLLYGRGWFRPRLAAVTCYIKHCGYEWFRSWSCCVTCYIEHWLWVVQILIMLQSLVILNTVAVSASNPPYAAVTGCYIEHCGCEWFRSCLCCIDLL